MCLSLWHISISIMPCESIHVVANGKGLFLFMAEWCPTMYLHHVFFIQSSVDGHLTCSHTLAIINNAVISTGVRVTFQSSVFVFFRCCIQEWNCWVTFLVLFLVFWETSIMFSWWLHQFTFPTIVCEGSKEDFFKFIFFCSPPKT